MFIDGSVNGVTYGNMLQNTLPGLLDGLQLPEEIRNNIIYMHDGAPAHWDGHVRAHLNNAFPRRWIGRGGAMHWPARSPDLNICDYFLWGHIKQLVYQGNVQDRELTRRLIINAFQSIPSNMLINATNELRRRINLCLRENGGQFEFLPRR